MLLWLMERHQAQTKKITKMQGTETATNRSRPRRRMLLFFFFVVYVLPPPPPFHRGFVFVFVCVRFLAFSRCFPLVVLNICENFVCFARGEQSLHFVRNLVATCAVCFFCLFHVANRVIDERSIFSLPFSTFLRKQQQQQEYACVCV